MPDLPSGTVTFLFTDIEGSTALWERDRAAMGRRSSAILRSCGGHRQPTAACSSRVVGDALQAAFPPPRRPSPRPSRRQRALVAEDWAERSGPLRVRMALHAGEAEATATATTLPPAQPACRLLAAGHGGQILLSQAAQELARDALPAGVEPARPGRAPAA